MNQIELIINEHNEKFHPEVYALAESLGSPIQQANQGALGRLPRNKQLLLVAEYHQFIQIRDRLALIAPQDPATWPQQFDALAKAQWELTLGTALEYFENPASPGYSLLAAAASVIFPSLTTEQRMDKLVRGRDWGIQAWVKLRQVNLGQTSHARRRLNCHAELVIEPSIGLTRWQGVVTDGTRALDVADLLESFAPHLPHPLAQRLLQEFISELKQQYPALYKALGNYNAEVRGLLSYLDQSQTPREALEQLRKVFFADAKLLTGSMYASEKSHQATAVFSAYLASVSPEARDALGNLKASDLTLNGIIDGINEGMCVELAAGEITSFLSDPKIASTLDRVPQRVNAATETTKAWIMTDADQLLQRGILQHEIPLNLLQTVLNHLRTQIGDHSGLWLASLMNLISANEQEQLIHKVLGKLSAKRVLKFLSMMQLPKQIIILEAMDRWVSDNPFMKISEFAELVFAFTGTKSKLLQYLPNTLRQLEWSITDLLHIMRRGLEVEIKIILKPIADTVFITLSKILNEQTHTAERDILLARENAAAAWRLITLWSPTANGELIDAFIMPSLSTGQLGFILTNLDESSFMKVSRILNANEDWNDKVSTEFEEFAWCLMRYLAPEGQQRLCDLLEKHCRNQLLNAIHTTANISNLCSALEDRGLYAVASMLWGLVEETFLHKQNFKNYAGKLSDSDFTYLVNSNETALTALMLEDSEWLAAIIEKLPLDLAKIMWDIASRQDGITQDLTLTTINRLFVILPREEFERLFFDVTDNILESFSVSAPHDLAQFACHALRHEQGLSLWLILQQAAIGTSMERMHNLLIMLSFLAKYAGHAALPDDEQLIQEYEFMHRGGCYSDYFDLLREQGHENAVVQLRKQLAMQIHSIKDFEYVRIRCNALDSTAILAQRLPELTSQGLRAGDFSKLVGNAPRDTVQQVWQALHYLPMLSVIDLIDLKVLAVAMPTEALQSLCESLRGRVAEMVRDVISFHFVLKNLPDDKQQLLLEWALDVLRPMIIRSMQQTHLLLNLSPAMQAQWRPRLPIFKKGPGQQGLFSAPPCQTMTTEAPPVPSPPK